MRKKALVLEVIAEELSECNLVAASDYDSAKKLIESDTYDLVILDIIRPCFGSVMIVFG